MYGVCVCYVYLYVGVWCVCICVCVHMPVCVCVGLYVLHMCVEARGRRMSGDLLHCSSPFISLGQDFTDLKLAILVRLVISVSPGLIPAPKCWVLNMCSHVKFSQGCWVSCLHSKCFYSLSCLYSSHHRSF